MATVSDDMRLVTGGFRLAYKHWKPAGGPAPDKRMVCYPGWLDNAGSFDNLAQVYVEQGWELLCLDPPGCGKSQHSPRYNDLEEVPIIVGLVEALGWTSGPRFVSVGHSRGGGVMLMFASAFPEYTKGLVVIENRIFSPNGGWPNMYDRDAVKELRVCMRFDNKNYVRLPRIFDTYDDAVTFSEKNRDFPKSHSSADNLTKRQVRQLADGRWQYTHDVRMYGQRQLMYPAPQRLREFASHLSVPTLHILCDTYTRVPTSAIKGMEERTALVKDYTRKVVAGLHHVHTDDPELTVATMADFLQRMLADTSQCQVAKL